MVSREKTKYFRGRLAEISGKRKAAIKEKYPEVKISYPELINAGAGQLRSEEEIRKACGSIGQYSCPPMVRVLEIFDLNGEQKKAEKEASKVNAARAEEFSALDEDLKRADDLLHFGTDEQLLAKLEELDR